MAAKNCIPRVGSLSLNRVRYIYTDTYTDTYTDMHTHIQKTHTQAPHAHTHTCTYAHNVMTRGTDITLQSGHQSRTKTTAEVVADAEGLGLCEHSMRNSIPTCTVGPPHRTNACGRATRASSSHCPPCHQGWWPPPFQTPHCLPQLAHFPPPGWPCPKRC